MAIEKNNFKVSRIDSDFSPSSRKSMSSEEDELQRRSSAVESDDDDEFDDADSGAGSDDFDLLELGETGVEFCQIGNQTCSIPFELYDLQGLGDILSIDVWNECLSEEERLGLAKYLPDMDQENFMLTMAELFKGSNFHFGSPITKLFDMLKGGLCEPRVALYREGWNYFQKKKHYHHLRKHQNTMVSNVCQIRDAWQNCRGYSIEERLRVLNIMKSQKSLMHEVAEDVETDSSERDSDELLRNMRVKDRQIAPKTSRNFDYGVRVKATVPSQGRVLTLNSKHGKQNLKGTLKLGGSKNLAGKEPVGRAIPAFHGVDMNAGAYSSEIAFPRHGKTTGYEMGPPFRVRDHMRSSEDAEEAYAIGDQRDRYSAMDGSGISKIRRKHNLLRGNEFAPESSMGGFPVPSNPYGKRRDVDFFSDAKVYTAKPPSMRPPYELSKKSRNQEDYQQFEVSADHMKPVKGRLGQQGPKGIRFDSSERADSFWNSRGQDEAFALDSPFRSDDWSGRSKKWKVGKESPELNLKSFKTSSPQQTNDRFLPAEYRANPYEEENLRGQNGGPSKASAGDDRFFNNDEETESESSDQSFGDEDNNPLLRSKIAYPVSMAEASQSASMKPGRGSKKAKLAGKKDMNSFDRVLDGITYSSKTVGGFGEQGHSYGVDNYSSKVKQKGKMQDSNFLNESPARILEDDKDDRISNLVKNGHLSGEPSEMIHIPSVTPHPSGGKKKKGGSRKISVTPIIDHGVDEADDSLQVQQVKSSTDVNKQGRFKMKSQKTEPLTNDHFERSEAPLLGCSSSAKKRKAEEDADFVPQSQRPVGNSSSSKKKAKKKVESDVGCLNMETSEPPAPEMELVDVEPEIKTPIKPFPIITPTVHTGFSFSVIHLLSAIRVAMVTPLPEDTLAVEKVVTEQSGQQHEGDENGALTVGTDRAGEASVPSLTVHEIVNRVRSNPGDPCILETQEPLQDLVRGVLKIFSSKTAPLGAKAWKPLAIYERPTKSWAWLGPVHEPVEEVISPEAWGLPHKTMVKLVDSFANWLKSGQETLQQIGSLPSPPVSLMQLNLDEKERFRDLRAQKSLNTINPSSEEVRTYFRREEVLRYLIPDRAFSYTAADGKRSIVAPLRRCGGKPTSKARDHFMLKRDRPPHVTILCLVRDAAARLPGSIGTRADVCTLIRDSQYIVEEVSDAQVNQVVSGALDRLHYERDPCVQFDGERKLWVYLHRDREEEDFEDDGTSSTKKWKRQKKDATEPDDQTAVTVAYQSSDQPGIDLCSDLNAEPSSLDAGQNVDDNVDLSHGPENDDIHRDPPMAWEALEENSIEPGKLLCEENSTNEDFDEDAFSREKPVGLVSASLS